MNESGRITVADKSACILCEECVTCSSDIGKKGLIKISHDTERVRFTVESTGVLSAVEIVKRALKVLQGKWNTLQSDLASWEKLQD